MTESPLVMTTTPSNPPATGTLITTNAPVNSTNTTDASDDFFRAVKALYALFLAISDLLPFLTIKLESSATSLKSANDIQAMFDQAYGLTQSQRDANGDAKFGGGTTPEAIARGQEILDYLHSIGIATDFPAGNTISKPVPLTKDNNLVKYQIAFGWSQRLAAYIDNIKTRSSITTTEADGVQKAANAAIDFTTTFLKALQSLMQGIALNLKN